MSYGNRWLGAVLIMGSLSLLLMACQQSHGTPSSAEPPSEIEPIDGTELSRVTLTERAIQRIDLKTDQVRDAPRLGISTASVGGDPEAPRSGSGTKQTVVPYSSLIYDPQGQTWVYISPTPRTFVRHKVDVDYIEGDIVVLNDGPATGTIVASVGVAELYGTEFEVGH